MLRKCRDFLITVTCKDFNHIDIPGRIRVGDSFEVIFSSNIKSFTFTVRSIDLTDGTCRLSDVAFPEEDPAADQLVAESCAPAP